MAHDPSAKRRCATKADRIKVYPVEEACRSSRTTATAKFDESVDVSINLGIDAKKSDQTVRGSVVLPKGTGKTKRVAVFAQGDKAKAAKMRAPTSSVSKIWRTHQGRKHGFRHRDRRPRSDARGRRRSVRSSGRAGSCPIPKVGTVTPDVATAVQNAKAGQVQYRTDKGGHRPVHDRSGVVPGGGARGESEGAGRCDQQGEAGAASKAFI